MSTIKRINFTDGFSSEVTPSETVIGASSFIVGSGVPSSGTGNDGDYYLDADSGNIYLKASGSWSVDSVLSLPASGIVNTPAGNVSATDVQAAIDELDSEKLDKTGGTISGNLTVSGDLQVDGTTTTLNTTTLDVEDANITVNNGGTEASADSADAGLTVEMSDATDVVIGFDSTLTSKFKIGESGSEVEIADVSSSQLITGKDIDGGTASDTNRITLPKDTTTNLDLLTDKEATIAYDTTLASLVINDGTDWNQVTGGSGGSGINYTTNPQFEVSSDSVNVSSNVTKGLDSSTPLRGTQSLTLSFSASATASDYGEILLDTFDASDVAKDVYTSFNYKTDANYNADEIQVVLRNNDSTVDEIVHGGNGDGNIAPSSNGLFTGHVYLPASDTDYSLYLRGTISRSDITVITVDNVKVGPGSIVDSPIIGDWIEFTPTSAWTSNVTHTGYYRRVGDSAEITFTSDCTGTPTTANLTYSMIPGLTIDTAKHDLRICGSALMVESGVREYVGSLRWDGGQFVIGHTETGNAGNVNQASPFIWGTSDLVTSSITLPIEEWANSSAVLSTTEMMNTTAKARATTNTAQGMTGTIAIIDYEDVDFDDLGNVTTGAGWKFTATKAGVYEVDAALMYVSTAWSALSVIRLDLYKNGVAYSTLDYQTFSTAATQFEQVKGHDTIELQKGDYIDIRSSHTNGGTVNTHTNSVYNHISIKQTMDNSVYSVYGETEVVSSHSDLTNYLITAGTWGDLTSIDLTQGEWDIAINGVYYSNGATTTTAVELGFSEDTGTSFTDKAYGDNTTFTHKDTSTFTGSPLNLNYQGMIINSDTTINLKAKAATSITNLQVAYKISARKIK